jgi:opacity protein-like surface antigen
MHARSVHPGSPVDRRAAEPRRRGRHAPGPGLRGVAARALAAAAFAGACAPAAAQHVDDRWWLHVAAFRPSIASTARSDLLLMDRPGTEVSFESELGLAGRKTLPWLNAGTRLTERWRLELEYFSLRRSGTRTSSREIAWGDTVFPVSATISSEFDSDVLRVSGGYSFLLSDGTEAGAVLGLHATRFRLALAGQATVANVSGSGQSEAEEALVPLPTIGVYAKHDFPGRLSIAGRVDWFGFRSGEYEGGLVNAMAAVNWRATDRVGVALGYRLVDYDLDVTKTNWRGGVSYRFHGPYLALQVGF